MCHRLLYRAPVVLALALWAGGCDSDEAAAPEPTPEAALGETLEATTFAGGTRFEGFIGYAVEVPAAWTLEPGARGVDLIPPEPAEGERYAVRFGALAEGAEAPEGAVEEGGWMVRLETTEGARAAELSAIEGTLELTEPTVPSALVGNWYNREENQEGSGNSFYRDETEKWMKLRDDGTFRLRTAWKVTNGAHTEGDIVESQGRWTAYGATLFRVFEDDTDGSHAFRLAGRALELEPEGQAPQEWEEDPDFPF